MKTFKVAVNYLDAQPGEETYHMTKTYIVQADCEANADQKAMEMCAQEAWYFEPLESQVVEIVSEAEAA